MMPRVMRSSYFALSLALVCLLNNSPWRALAAPNGTRHTDQRARDKPLQRLNTDGRYSVIDQDDRGLHGYSLLSIPVEDDISDLPGAEPNENNGKSMLKNKTMMRNHMAKANLNGMSVITGFCITGLHCWPIQVFAITIAAIHIIAIVVAIYISASLYSNGLSSGKFYQGGGFVLIGMSLLGLGVGAGTAYFLDFTLLKFIALAGPMMSLFGGMVLIGRRGILLGALGGTCAGVPIGTMMQSQEVGITLGAIVGMLVGCILGVCPFFNNLDMNQRYLNKQNQFGSFSEPGSINPDVYGSYPNVIKMQTADYR